MRNAATAERMGLLPHSSSTTHRASHLVKQAKAVALGTFGTHIDPLFWRIELSRRLIRFPCTMRSHWNHRSHSRGRDPI